MGDVAVHHYVVLFDDGDAVAIDLVVARLAGLGAGVHGHGLVDATLVLAVEVVVAGDLAVFNLDLGVVEYIVIVVDVLYYLDAGVPVLVGLLLRLRGPAAFLVGSVQPVALGRRGSALVAAGSTCEVIRMRAWVVLHTLMTLVSCQVPVSVRTAR